MEYEICVRIQEYTVYVDLNISLTESEKVYYYLCISNGETVRKSGWKNKSSYVFDRLETDCYYIKAFVLSEGQKYVKKSEWFDYVSVDDREKFETFCMQDRNCSALSELNPWHLYHLQQPYTNFCFIQGNYHKEDIHDFCAAYGLDAIECRKHTGKNSLLVKEKSIPFLDSGIVLSGIGKTDGKLTAGSGADVGKTDRKTAADAGTEISDKCLGTFTYCKILPGRGMEIGTDYFGTGKIYYYQDKTIFACSNHYHMLLILLQYAQIKLAVNHELVNALLCKMNQTFTQRFSRECEVRGIRIMPAGKKILAGENIQFVDTDIAAEFVPDQDLSDREYLTLLENGKQEILENTNAALTSSRYQEMVVELTGGLDSRIVYGAVTNFNYKDKKIYVHTKQLGNNQSDLETAVQVNRVYEFPWDHRIRRITKRRYKDTQDDRNSHFLMGGYYLPLEMCPFRYDILSDSPEKLDTVFLNGFSGEICCRPYYTRNMLYKFPDIEQYGIEQIMPLIANKKDILSMKTYHALQNVMKKELELLPGRNYAEKYELHYLFYRNSLHSSKVREYDRSGEGWSVLQSKNLFRLNRNMYLKKTDIKLQLDVLHLMNPILGCLPFEADKDNEAKSRLCEELYYSDQRFKYAHLRLENSMEEWKEEHGSFAENAEYIAEERFDLAQVQKENEEWKEKWKERLELLLHELMKYKNGIYKEQFGIDVYVCFCLKRNRTEAYYKMLYNKLLSLYLQLRIIDPEYGEMYTNSEETAAQ